MVDWGNLSEIEFNDFMDEMITVVSKELSEKRFDVDYEEVQKEYRSPHELVQDFLKDFDVEEMPELQDRKWWPDNDPDE